MIQLYDGQKHSIYEMQNYCGCSDKTIYNYANGKRKIEDMSVGIFLKIAKLEKADPIYLYNEIEGYLSRKYKYKQEAKKPLEKAVN